MSNEHSGYHSQPVALHYNAKANATFYSERGSDFILIYLGNEITNPHGQVIGRVAVPPTWLDMNEVRSHASAWLREQTSSRLRRADRR